MKQISKLSILSLLMALAVGASSTSFADKATSRRNKRDRSEMQNKMLEKMKSDLSLTDDQVTKIKAIHEQNRTQKEETRSKIHEAMENLDAALSSNATKEDVQAKFEVVQNLKLQAGKQRFDEIWQVRQVLTPEQQKKFREKRKDRMKKFKGKRGRHAEELEDGEGLSL